MFNGVKYVLDSNTTLATPSGGYQVFSTISPDGNILHMAKPSLLEQILEYLEIMED